MKKLITFTVLTVAGFLTTAGACSDPGDPNGGGRPRTFMIAIHPGSHTITKAYYGLWYTVSDPGGRPTASCRWSITKHGKLAQSGGWKDDMVIGPSLRGGTVTVGAACYEFGKA